MNEERVTIADLIMEYFRKHPKKNLKHGPVVDYVEERYFNLYERKPRDTWRQIRRLHQEGILIKVRKGVYRYDPDYVYKLNTDMHSGIVQTRGKDRRTLRQKIKKETSRKISV